MELCHIVPSTEIRHGGTSVSVPRLARALADLGHSTELLTTGPEALPAIVEKNFRIETFRRDWPQRLCPSTGLRQRLEESRAEVIHHHGLWLRTLHYAHRRARSGRASLVLSPRGMMNAWAWRHRHLRKQLSRVLVHPGAFEAVNGWHATSEDEAREIAALGFRQPICVAPNGVSAPEPAQMQRAAEFWRQLCPAASRRRVALFYSRFHEKKRVLELIDLWLQRAPRDWLLLLVGIPEQYSPSMLEQHIAQASGQDRVLVFSGADRPPPYAIASLFLLPSHSENFGLVIAEAQAHGVPVLVTDGTPWAGVNVDERGWCVPWPEYGQTLSAALQESPERLRDRGMRAREWVMANFSWEKSARALAAFYRQLSPGSFS